LGIGAADGLGIVLGSAGSSVGHMNHFPGGETRTVKHRR
jgi:hypothetical protein